MRGTFRIGDRLAGDGQPCFVIAEAGVNHIGDLSRALELVDVAASAGADAVKFQTFDADRLATRDAPKAEYQTRGTRADESQHAMLARLQLDQGAHVALMRRCAERGITFLSTPFDEQAADLLDALGVTAFKTPSGELTNLAFLRHVAAKGKPLVVSTGMATLAEVEDAMRAIEETGAGSVALLHCVSNYPAAPGDANLRAMATLARAFGVPVGYSDHTLGLEVALASVALGACVLEKHFTLDRALPGPDHAASLDPVELAALVRGVRTIESALGDGRKRPAAAEAATARVARKSLVARFDIPAGELVTESHLVAKRPGDGLPPSMRDQLLGRAARVPIAAGTVLRLEMFA